MLLDIINPFLILLNWSHTSKFKMAAKTDNFRISPISANNSIKNIGETPRCMLLDTINPFLTLLNWSDDVSQNGSRKLENL